MREGALEAVLVFVLLLLLDVATLSKGLGLEMAGCDDLAELCETDGVKCGSEGLDVGVLVHSWNLSFNAEELLLWLAFL